MSPRRGRKRKKKSALPKMNLKMMAAEVKKKLKEVLVMGLRQHAPAAAAAALLAVQVYEHNTIEEEDVNVGGMTNGGIASSSSTP